MIQTATRSQDQPTPAIPSRCSQHPAAVTDRRLQPKGLNPHHRPLSAILWLVAAAADGSGPIKRFAAGLRKDYPEVAAAFTFKWSNGPTEGFINKLKLLKRQMYGRAKLDLLRKRILSQN